MRGSMGWLSAALALATVACSGSSSPTPSAPAAGAESPAPSATLEEFYRHLDAGDFASAMALYNAEALDIWEDPANTGGTSFAEWARMQTRNGELERVQVVSENRADAEGRAEIEFDVVYADGSTKRRSVSLTQEEGSWRMGLIR